MNQIEVPPYSNDLKLSARTLVASEKQSDSDYERPLELEYQNLTESLLQKETGSASKFTETTKETPARVSAEEKLFGQFVNVL